MRIVLEQEITEEHRRRFALLLHQDDPARSVNETRRRITQEPTPYDGSLSDLEVKRLRDWLLIAAQAMEEAYASSHSPEHEKLWQGFARLAAYFRCNAEHEDSGALVAMARHLHLHWIPSVPNDFELSRRESLELGMSSERGFFNMADLRARLAVMCYRGAHRDNVGVL